MNHELATRDRPSSDIAVAITDTMDQLKAVRTFIKEEFVEGTDYGKIPGCGDKPALLLPGAQKATMYFNCYPTYKVKATSSPGGHLDFRVRCILISRATGSQVGEGIGCCSTMEKKYRWRKAERICPKCKAPAIINGKVEYGGGFVCFGKKGGCGAKFADGAQAIVSQPQGQVENDEIYDLHNTILKMAKKRAHVDASITLACLSELFTQDIEDTYDIGDVKATVIQGEVVDAYVPEIDSAPRHPQGKNNPHPNASTYHNGQYAWPEDTIAYLKWLDEKLNGTAEMPGGVNGQWADFWQDPKTGEFPPHKDITNEFMSKYQADGHLVKWLVQTGQIDQDALDKSTRAAKLGRHAAILKRRTKAEFVAMAKELDRYLAQSFEDKKNAIYHKRPELAPEGWLEEQNEANAIESDSPAEQGWQEGRE